MSQRSEELLVEFANDLQEMGLSVAFLGVAADRPLPSLAVVAPPGDDGAPRSVTLAFVPDDDELEEVDLLQLFLLLSSAPIGLRSQAEIAQLLMAANQRAVLGHAGVTDEGELYWRHIWPIPKGLPLVPSALFEVLNFFVFSADLALLTLRGKAPFAE